jgi:hypothetical protein
MSERVASPGLKFGAPQLVGTMMLALVGAVYGYAITTPRWPPSHPYSGFTLTALAFVLITLQPQADPGRARLTLIGAGVAMLGALAWLASAILQVS